MINFPTNKIIGLENKTENEISNIITGKNRSEIKNYYLKSELTTSPAAEVDWRKKIGTLNVKQNTNIYVNNTAQNASNSNSGTINNPLLTINEAYSRVTDGQTIQVIAGTYIENLDMNKNSTANNPIVLEGKLDSNNNQHVIEIWIRKLV